MAIPVGKAPIPTGKGAIPTGKYCSQFKINRL
jgi:hypothetical protein